MAVSMFHGWCGNPSCRLCGAMTFHGVPGPDPAPAPELSLTFGTEPLIGWRTWELGTYARRGCDPTPCLRPIARGGPWKPGKRVEAECVHGSHDAPNLRCECGLWALRTREEAERMAAGTSRVFGSVFLWGRVLEFDKGYRAQYAYPRELFAYGEAPVGLAELYRVPVKVIERPKMRTIDPDLSAFARMVMAMQPAPPPFFWSSTSSFDPASLTFNGLSADPPKPRKDQHRENIEKLRAERLRGKRRLP